VCSGRGEVVSNLVVDLFLSVDGWAGSDGLPGYFGYLGPELQEWIIRESAEPQMMLLGRRTYEMLSGLPDDARDDSTDQLALAQKVVFSRTLTSVVWPNTRVSGDLLDEVRALKADSDVPLRTAGSLSVVQQLLDAGLVDRLRLMNFPLIAGPAGREAAFAGMGSADLDLVDQRVLDSRVLLVEYAPTGNDIPRA
jgi:dihydrofolate reductase